MNYTFSLLQNTIVYSINLFTSKFHILFIGLFLAALCSTFLDPVKLKEKISNKTNSSILGSVTLGTFSPLCACGTMAITISLMTTVLPWGAIMAFLTSSPIMGPEEFAIVTGVVSVRFAIALTISSLMIGILTGYGTHWISKNTRFLDHQMRIIKPTSSSCCTQDNLSVEKDSCNCSKTYLSHKMKKVGEFMLRFGLRRMIPFFLLFASIGFLINELVPTDFIIRYLGPENSFAIILFATIGLPIYVGTVASAPMIYSLLQVGVNEGALLAFMITGSGTSIAVIMGLSTIMKPKVIGLYIMYVLVFGILFGYVYDIILSLWYI